MANSTIRHKKGKCSHPGCSYTGPLIAGQCQSHYWSSVKMRSAARLDQKELSQNESLSAAMEDLDIVFSQYIRLRDSDENGYIICPCCGSVKYWTQCDNMHYVPRIHQNTRYSEENCHGGCRECNQSKDGNLIAYGDFLEKGQAGRVEMLEEQGRTPYSYSVSEIKGLISHYAKLVKSMKAKIPLNDQ